MAQAPSRCINHPERTAVARCKQCHKPLCEKCVKKMPGGVYCSDECYQRMGSFQERVKKLDEAPKAGLNVGKLVTRIVIAVIVVAILYYVFVSQQVRSIGDLTNLIRGLLP